MPRRNDAGAPCLNETWGTRQAAEWPMLHLRMLSCGDMCKTCSLCILNKLNSFSGIDLMLAFRRGSRSAAAAAKFFSSGTQGQLIPYFLGFLLVPGGVEPP